MRRIPTDPQFPLTARPAGMRFALEPRAGSKLQVEPRRALALLRALDLDANTPAAQRLLRFAGLRGSETQVVSERSCQALAEALRRDGYPLDDEGIGRFKAERGYSRIIRISPAVAAAYARFADGAEARLEVPPERLALAAQDLRRALDILMHIGREPRRLLLVRAALDLPAVGEGPVIGVGIADGKALLRWAEALGIGFADAGLRRLRATVDRRAAPETPRNLDTLAQIIARWVIAADEPQQSYERVAADDGHAEGEELWVNRRTYFMLGTAELDLARRGHGAGVLRLLRGSYETPHGRGAHPHQGGGVVDLGVSGGDNAGRIDAAVSALRRAGFAAWYRARRGRPHIHAIAIGDREISAAARWQVKGFFQGRDGRSRAQPDPHAQLAAESPTWSDKYAVAFVE